MKKFTDQQIKDFKDYEKVRASGKYNMVDPRARRAAGLNDAEYCFVMDNFSALRGQAEQTKGTFK